MKRTRLILVIVVLLGAFTNSFSQSINWKNLQKEERHIISAYAGWDYALVFEAAYGYQLKSKMPIVLTANYSFPSGEELVDDFKTRVGAQARIYQNKNFQLSAGLQGVYRRYESTLVRMQNYGAELTTVAGYYKSQWFIAGEVGFDKAIATHIRHTDGYRENIFSEVRDGWYASTGGNFIYGLQSGYSFKRHDVTFKIGKTVTQNFKTTPLIPYYLQLGYNFRISG